MTFYEANPAVRPVGQDAGEFLDARPATDMSGASQGASLGRPSLTFIGTATVLFRFGGFTLLTDPNFLHQGEHAALGAGLRSRRLTEPSCSIADLPPLDAVVLSHHHGDHFDHRAADELDRDVPIVTTGHAARKLGRQGFHGAVPLATWATARFERNAAVLDVTATPARHAPGLLERVLPETMGSIWDFRPSAGPADARPALRVYVTGDTLYGDHLVPIAERYPDVDLMVLHLGGTRVMGILLTMDAAQGTRALQLVAPRHAVPVHYDDYTVFRSSLEEFRRQAARVGVASELHYLTRGETLQLPTSGGPIGA